MDIPALFEDVRLLYDPEGMDRPTGILTFIHEFVNGSELSVILSSWPGAVPACQLADFREKILLVGFILVLSCFIFYPLKELFWSAPDHSPLEMPVSIVEYLVRTQRRLVFYLAVIRDMVNIPPALHHERDALIMTYSGVWDDVPVGSLSPSGIESLQFADAEVMRFLDKLSDICGVDLSTL